MSKRLKVVGLLAAFGLVIAACGGTQGTTTVAPDTTGVATTAGPGTTLAPTTTGAPGLPVGLVFDIGGRGDQSFNDSAAAGLDKAAAELGIVPAEASANADGSDREELLSLLATSGSELVFGIGFLFSTPMANAAFDNPDVNFAIVDSVVSTYDSGTPDDFDANNGDETEDDVPLTNVASLVFAEEQGSFLVGAAAALNSATGKVGFIGGVEIDLIKKFEAGFIAGAKAVNPDIEIDSQYVTVPPDFAGFNDPAAGKVIAQSMFEGGADVVYHAAGGTGAGLFAAAKEFSEAGGSKVWAIGVDSDQYNTAGADVQEYILTSMLKRVDVSVFNTIKSQVDGAFNASVNVFNLEVDGVGYSTTGGFVDAIAAQLDDFKAKIISGEIVVPTAPEA